MLIRFGVSNHRSIRDRQELLLTASRRLPKDSGLTFPVPVFREAVVPVVALYGANASGKSNLLDAINMMREQVVHSHQRLEAGEAIPRRPFLLDDKGRGQPTRFDCTFTIPEAKQDAPRAGLRVAYEYGFEFNEREFTREWLYQIVLGKRRSTRTLFRRRAGEGKPRFSFGNGLHGENEIIGKLTRSNSLFLSTAAQNNHPQLTAFFRYFRECWAVNFPDEDQDRERMLIERMSISRHQDSISDLLTQADLGLAGVDVVSRGIPREAAKMVKEVSQVVTKHLSGHHMSNPVIDPKRLQFLHYRSEGGPVPLGYDAQSHGTRRLLSLLIPACEALSTGTVMVVDEMNAILHPRLQQAFVSLFKQKESNPRGAQLIFSTHGVTLLEDKFLRHDEVWFTDKNGEGATELTPLTDFRIRSRDNVERFYRQGRLGGVPRTDSFAIALEDAGMDGGRVRPS